MHILLRETTVWSKHDNMNNGTYVFEKKPKSKKATAIGYIPANSDKVDWFPEGLDIDMKNRTFEEIKNDTNCY